ncbi:autotransporter outer membrane beta-barrel domain-containing protein [Bordetella bronchiseptica]|uniref:autotransporter outer membrane beta-barrel domain-containing protein n=2 Tax=Bordetella bronchiseptica TaxID=518 RepID=UPI0005059447|nr:autotransporter outer membrane beta-barrel domain-containing protein [Bordetella bronchiseptica]KFJ53496.1 outer membrane autotransporter barrel domain protein [Bordetella bronchiseptica]MCE7074142.1 autotransporter outer membrane beta-barrel domain-containing protein [Bordetella bronchiseptica]RFT72777.1 autotransporter outer membrane beta-barrel domain-containing protein [Bordetella bronchiseptica]SUV62225.1 Fluffing protein [Bordetella bronchiseptica]
MPQRSQPFNSCTGHSGVRGHGVAPTVLVLALGFHGTAAWANCQTAGSAVTCDASSPNPYTGTVGSGASSGNLTITVGPGARIESGNAHAISVGTGNTISLDGNAQVSNSVTTGGPGNYNAGLNTIEFEHSNTLMIGADARVAAEGTDPAAHAIAFTGRSNAVTNYGTVSSASGAAIWNQFEDDYVNNTIHNYGVIETTANGGDAVVIGSATGNGASGRGMTLYNYAGGRIVGNVVLGEGDDTVRLEAGSTLTGSLDGGAAGTDVLYLEGTSGSGELTQDISNFNEINKIVNGSTWTLAGSLGANSSGKATVVNAYNGELIVTGDNSAATAGSMMTVWAGARLQVNTTSAMAAIQSNGSGVAAFSQQTDGTYAGVLSGSGNFAKEGAGSLTLTGVNTYTGTLQLKEGKVIVSAAENLGGANSMLEFDGGTLNTTSDMTSVRRASIAAGGGTFEVAGGTTLNWTGRVTGNGTLVKEGAGTLALSGFNAHGGTVVNAGTVQISSDYGLGNGALTLNNSRLASTADIYTEAAATVNGNGTFDTANGTTLQWMGDIGGAGALVKTGAGTLLLGGDSLYAGGTVVNAGTVQVFKDASLGGGALTLNNASLASLGSFSTARAATLTGNGTFDTADGTTLGWTGDIGGAGALVKTGQGTLVLDGDNQYGGGTTVNAGTVQVSRDANLGAAAGAVALNDARLASTGTFSTARAATLTGNGTFDTADGTALGWTGDIGGAGALVKEGLGTLVLDGDNQYGGGTTVNAGTVQVARDANLGAAGGAVRLQGATLASTGSFASARALTLGAAGGTFATLGATTLGWDAAIDGAGGLTKTGAGDLVLSQANTYAGPTLIKEGRLAVNGSIASPVTIDPGGVLGGTGRVLGAVANSGTVAPGNSIGTLTIVGNYAGTGGRLEMEAQLGGDASPADRLVIDGGAATGRTDVVVINQGGLGGQTDQGIPLVVARNGATTTADAFSLASPVAAGAYEYKLLRGTPDGTAANAQNWYLRSGLLVPPAEVPGGGPGGAPEPEFIPFYRPEVALYAGAPMLMRAVGLQALGTYHERTGEQGLMTRDDPDPVRRGAWTRAFGRTFERSGSGDVDPRFDGHVAGLQAGVDLYARRSDQGHADLAGVFGGYANARGHMDGFARGETGAYAGKPDLNAYYIGGYWTHIGPSGWYVDAVLAGTRYEQKAKSSNDLRTEAKGWGVTASVEAGYPVPIGEKWHIEPQAQLVYQRLTVSNGEDDVSSVSYRTPDSVTARLGARLSGQYAYNTTQLRPFMEVSLLRDFAGTDTVTFSGIDRIDSRYQATAVDLTAGLVAQVRKDVGLWGQVGYGKSIGGGDGSDRGWAASLGLRIEY